RLGRGGAGVEQDGVVGRAHDIGLIGDHQPSRNRVEHLRIELGEMPPSGLRVIGRKHLLGSPPWPVPLDDAGDGHVADLERAHFDRSPVVSSAIPAASGGWHIFFASFCGTSRSFPYFHPYEAKTQLVEGS